MERYNFYVSLYPENNEYIEIIQSLENEGKTYLEAITTVAAEVKIRRDQEAPINAYGSEKFHYLERLNKELSDYVKCRKWFEIHKYLPRKEPNQFDIDRCKESAKTKTLIEQKIYWETLMEEFSLFAQGGNYMYGWPFQLAAKAELLTINAELAFDPKPTKKKLKWLRKPSEFGHLFSQLVQLEYIQLPDGAGINYNELARIFLEMFDFDGGTTFQSLAKELNPAKNQLSNDIKDKFQIPDTSELKPKTAKKTQ